MLAGYALLEALVAVVVAAVGFIGAARMQTFGLQLSGSAQSRQKAVLLAYQMTDRIRANRTAALDGHYNNPDGTGSVACLATATGCSPAALAAADAAQWLGEVQAQLPSGAGRICVDSTPNDGTAADWQCDGTGSAIAIKVRWDDGRGNAAVGQAAGLTFFATVIQP